MERTERFAAFLFYVDDWLSSTDIDLMTAAEERGYLRLLLHAWKAKDCGLPDDDRILARLSKLENRWRGKSAAILRTKFIVRNGRLFNERLLAERENQANKRLARSVAGKAGAEVRWHVQPLLGKKNGNGSPMESQIINAANELEVIETTPPVYSNAIAEPIANACDGVGKTMQAQAQAKIKEINTCPSPAGNARVSFPSSHENPLPGTASKGNREAMTPQQENWWNDFWNAYWRKDGRKVARQVFLKHVASEDLFQRVMTALQAQRSGQMAKDPQYRPMASSWLNGARWNDEPASAAVAAVAPVIKPTKYFVPDWENGPHPYKGNTGD